MMLELLFSLVFGWNLVAGVGVPPGDYAAQFQQCETIAVYGWMDDGAWPRWERWISGAPEYVNTLEFMDETKGYWVWCE